MQETQAHTQDKEQSPSSPRSDATDFKTLFSLLSGEFSRHRLRLAAGFAALVAVDFLQLVIPRILKRGVDALADGTATADFLLKLALLITVIAACVVVLRFCWRNLIIGFSRLLERALRNRIFTHILAMDQPFFEKRTTGDIMAHASNDLAAVQMACGMGMVAAVDSLVLSVAAIGFMLHIHPLLTVFALMPMPVLALSTKLLSGKLHHRFNTVQECFSRLTEFARSSLVSVKLSKAYTFEGLQAEVFDRIGKEYVSANIRVALVQGLLFPAATLIGNLGLLAILLYGGKLVIHGQISLGDFVAFITYLQMLIWPMMAVGWVANLLQRGITALKRIYLLTSARPLLADGENRIRPELILNPSIKIDDLTFTYPASSEPDLAGISFQTETGIIGIAGPTGSGKTTLCRLLLRLYPVNDGTIYFHGRDVNSLSLEDVRSHIAYVSQEPVLFSKTIRANIAYARPDASLQEIEEAAIRADIHDEILTFGSGYDTVIGERGVTLSGGQRQRLALARAFLCNRPVLVIDDGLSAVDTATESRILETLRESLTGKTVFIVSNRLKLLAMTDRILLLEQGRLAADSSHETLLETNEFYRRMHEKQMQQTENGATHA